MKLNLYQLCDKSHNKGSIKVILNNDLKILIKSAISKLKKQKITMKFISKEIGIDYTTFWKHLNKKEYISISILKDIELISKVQLYHQIRKLKTSQSNIEIKLPKQINENLSKIIGAIIADGHLRFRKSERGYHYELVIREGYKSNLDAFCIWFENVFNLKLKPKKKDNHYFVYLSNKIIFKFFNSVIGIPAGKKSNIVSIPPIIIRSNSKIKNACLRGVFMFDGGVDYRTGYVNLTSTSKKLIEDIEYILNELKLEPDYISLTPDNLRRYKIRYRKLSKLRKCLLLFEKNTEKWYRLNEHLYGLEETTKDLKIALKSFDRYYPKIRNNSITFSDVIKAINQLDNADLSAVAEIINRNNTVTYEFLRKLENWNVVRSSSKGLKKYYDLKGTLSIPRR